MSLDKAYATQYYKNQAILGTNVCGNDLFALNTLCQNIDSEIQGDTNTVGIIGLHESGSYSVTQSTPQTPRGLTLQSLQNVLEFGPILNLSNNPATSEESEIATAVSGRSVYVIWRDNSPGDFDIFFRRSTDGGVNFGPTENLSNTPGFSGDSKIVVFGKNVYVIWTDDSLGNSDILFRRSTDGGAAFDATENLSNSPRNSVKPQIAASENNVYVIWQDPSPLNFDIFFRRSTDRGAAFDATQNLSNNTGSSVKPQIAVSGNNVYVVWEDDTPSPGPGEVFFRRSTDRGATFDATVNLSNNAADSIEPEISACGINVCVIWTESSDIFFRASADRGATFDATVNLSNNAGNSTVPQISVSGMNVYVVWQDTNPGNNDIFFRRSTDRGATFDATQNISGNIGTSDAPRLAESGKNVYVVWRDNTVFPAANNEIFFRAGI